MATGNPFILGKDNVADHVTFLTRKDHERAEKTTALWVLASNPKSYAIRTDSVDSASILAVGRYGVNALTEAGIGVIGDASYGGALTLGIGVGGYAQSGVGVWGECANKETGFAGIFSGTVRVNGDFEVNGVKAAIVPLSDGSVRRLYCMESPESWFEDFGEARLNGGKAEVKIDRNFVTLVRGATHVFLTPHGDSKGLYVSRRSSRSFVVREQGGGKSTLTFSYRIVARRKDIRAPRLAKVKPTPEMKRPPRLDSVEKPKRSGTRARQATRTRRSGRAAR